MVSTYTEVFVAIAAIDLAPIVQFYEAVFSCKPVHVQGDRYAEFHLGQLRLSIFKPSTQNESEFSAQSSGLSLCLEVDDLDAFTQHLRTLGLSVSTSIMTASHGRELYIYDPLANRLILHEAKANGSSED